MDEKSGREFESKKDEHSRSKIFAIILIIVLLIPLAYTGYGAYNELSGESQPIEEQLPSPPIPLYNESMNYSMKAFWTDEVPVIDGVVNESAWNGVGTYTVVENISHMITIYASMDEDNLYVGVIAENDTNAEANDYCGIFFDVGHNETDLPDTNDVMVAKAYGDNISYLVGNGTDWVEFIPPPSSNCSANSSTTNSKVSWEYQIPIIYMNYYGRFNSTEDYVGFGVQVMDYDSGTLYHTVYPDDYGVGMPVPDNYLVPSTWADLYDGNSTDMIANFTATTPTINGVLASGEWDDADNYTVDLTEDIKVYTMQDNTYIYVAIEGLDDSTNDNTDRGTIYFDCDHDATASPDANDKRIRITGTGTISYAEGNGATWVTTTTPTGWTGGEGTTGGQRSYEFRVTISELNETGGFWQDSDEIGFGCLLHDDDGGGSEYWVWYPDNYDGSPPPTPQYMNDPSTWGDIICCLDSIPPELSNVADTPDPQEYNDYVNITVDVTDDIQVDTTWANITGIGNYSMTQGTGNEWYLNQTYTSVGQNNYTIWANDTSDNWNSSSEYNFTINDEVTINIISQNTSNVRWNSSGRFEVVANITTHTTPIDTDTILFAHTVFRTDTGSNNFTFHLPPNQNQPNKVRANARNEYRWFEQFNASGSGEIGDIGEWGVYENATPNINIIASGTNWTLCNFTTDTVKNMYAQASYIDRKGLENENKTGQSYNTYGINAVRTSYNISGSDPVSLPLNHTLFFMNFYAESVNNPDNLNVYISNSSYISGDPSTNDNCSLIGQVTKGQAYDRTIANSSYYEMSFALNSTGYLNNMLWTSNFSIIFDGGLDISNYWRIYYADDNITFPSYYYNFNQSETTQRSIGYTTWFATNGTIDCHIQGFRKDNQSIIGYKFYANDTSGNNNWSAVSTDIIDEVNIAPTIPIIIIPDGIVPTDEYFESEIINISGIWRGDNNGDDCWVNITCHNSTGNIVAWIRNNTVTLLDYYDQIVFNTSWDTAGTPTGDDYYINVTITDRPYGLSVYDIQNGTFNLLFDTLPEINNVSDQLDPQEYGGYVNITSDITDNLGVDTVSVNITGIGNYSMIAGSGDEWYYNNTYSILGTFNYVIWANDTSDSWNASAQYNFTVQDTTLPNITVPLATPYIQTVEGSVNITCNVTDNVAIFGVWVNITDPNGTYLNVSMVQGSGDGWYYNTTYDETGTYHYTIWANDTSDNWDYSIDQIFKVQLTLYDFLAFFMLLLAVMIVGIIVTKGILLGNESTGSK